MTNFFAFLRPPNFHSPLANCRFAKNLATAALSVVIPTIVGAVCPVAHAQTAHFSGSQISLPFTGLNNPRQVAADASGNLYIADSANHRVLKETLSGSTYVQSTIGSGLSSPVGVAIDASGNVYIADSNTGRILKETLSGNSYTQSTISSSLSAPWSVAVDASGNVFVADPASSRVLKETPSGNNYIESSIGISLSRPSGVAVDGSGNVYISDLGNTNDINGSKVFKETLSSGIYTQSTVASGLSYVSSVAVDGIGNIYISNYFPITDQTGRAESSQIFKETLSNGSYTQSQVGSSNYYNVIPIYIALDGSGNILMAALSGVNKLTLSAGDLGTVNVGSVSSPISLIFTFDTTGSMGTPTVLTQGATDLDFADAGTGTCNTLGTSSHPVGSSCTVNITLKPKSPGTRYGAALLKTSAGNVIATGYVHGIGSGPQVNFLPGVQSTLALSNVVNPYAIAEDASANLYIAVAVSANSPQNAVIKETWTGSGYIKSIIATGLSYPVGVAVDGAGNVYIADQNATQVLKMSPSSGGGYSQTGVFPYLGSVESVAVDGSGNVYIGSLAYGLLKETLTAGNYIQSTIARTVYAFGIAVDKSGNLYISQNGSELLKESLFNGTYIQSTITSSLNRTLGIAVDGNGNVYAADIGASMLIKETPSGASYTQSTIGMGLNEIGGVAVDASGSVFVSSTQTNSIWKVDFVDPPSLSFAKTTTGSTSSAQTVTIANIGDTALNFPIPSSGNNPSISSNFVLNNTGSASCPIMNTNSATVETLAAGSSCQLSVSFAPIDGGTIAGALVLTDTDFNAIAPLFASQSITLSGTALDLPVLIFAPITSQIYGNAPFTVSATSASSGTITYTVVSGPATISGSTVTLTGAGTVVLNASQAASGNYGTAATTTSFIVAPAMPVLSFVAIATQTYGNAPFTVSATSASSGTVTYTVVSGPATISGSIVTLTGAGTVVLNASQAANGNYAPATAASSFQVAAQTFSFAAGSSAGSSSATTTLGGAAIYTLVLTPAAGTTFPNTVTFSVSGLPTGATATFSPATLPAGSGMTSITLKIQTSNGQTARNENSSRGSLATMAFGLLLLPLVVTKSARKRLRQIPRLSATLALAVFSLGIVVSLSGCGSNAPSGQGAKNYTMVVAATDAATNIQSSTTLTLTVQ